MEALTKKRTVAGNVSRRQDMTTITLSYNAQNVLLNSIIQTALLAGAKQVQERQLTPFEQSLEDIKYGRITRIKNISNLLEECMQ
ncbi:MAG: hypothetical protein LBN27_00040 [Prevotellaceae bacterium]|jgi:hypothetical protein|nr:hypothetical protein [Prevotellaceae bacterium]